MAKGEFGEMNSRWLDRKLVTFSAFVKAKKTKVQWYKEGQTNAAGAALVRHQT